MFLLWNNYYKSQLLRKVEDCIYKNKIQDDQ